MGKKMKKIAITTGDPAGIGSEITAKALQFYPLSKDCIFIVYGYFTPPKDGNKIEKVISVEEAVKSDRIYWIEIGNSEIELGKPTEKSGYIAYRILEIVAADLQNKKLDAVVTNPISKQAIQMLHPEFIGHTEFFAQKSGVQNVVMSFWGKFFNLALLTTHLSLAEVSKKLTEVYILRKLRLIVSEAKKFIDKPKMAILGINPHAGENGAFGNEEILLKKILEKLRSENIIIDGPFPADTFFSRKAENYNLIIAAYHDQGLIPFKMIHRNEGVNVTLGLPFVRTSVDHGTAFDIVGKNLASERSLELAISYAEKMLGLKKVRTADIYDKFAVYYDDYMEHVDYRKWVNFIEMQANNLLGRIPRRTLELACGTGNIATIFSKRGWEIDASDISSEMLKIASRKTFSPHLFQNDMLNSIPKNKYELIILLFDSLNYLNDNKSVTCLLSNAYTGLKNNGVFIFDISTVKNCRDNFDGFVDLVDEKNEYLINQGEFDEELQMQKTELTFFTRKGFFYERNDEIHRQKIYKTSEILQLIKNSKFVLRGIFAADNPKNLLENISPTLDETYARLFFVVQKNAL